MARRQVMEAELFQYLEFKCHIGETVQTIQEAVSERTTIEGLKIHLESQIGVDKERQIWKLQPGQKSEMENNKTLKFYTLDHNYDEISPMIIHIYLND